MSFSSKTAIFPNSTSQKPAITTLNLKIPEGVLQAIRESANETGISVEQFFSSAAAEKLSQWRSLDWLRAEAAKGTREDFEKFLGAVPKIPDPSDEGLDQNDKNL